MTAMATVAMAGATRKRAARRGVITPGASTNGASVTPITRATTTRATTLMCRGRFTRRRPMSSPASIWDSISAESVRAAAPAYEKPVLPFRERRFFCHQTRAPAARDRVARNSRRAVIVLSAKMRQKSHTGEPPMRPRNRNVTLIRRLVIAGAVAATLAGIGAAPALADDWGHRWRDGDDWR